MRWCQRNQSGRGSLNSRASYFKYLFSAQVRSSISESVLSQSVLVSQSMLNSCACLKPAMQCPLKAVINSSLTMPALNGCLRPCLPPDISYVNDNVHARLRCCRPFANFCALVLSSNKIQGHKLEADALAYVQHMSALWPVLPISDALCPPCYISCCHVRMVAE